MPIDEEVYKRRVDGYESELHSLQKEIHRHEAEVTGLKEAQTRVRRQRDEFVKEFGPNGEGGC
jgi:predicted  nucleic acid-binding Zn-ribbon protein